MTEEKKVKKAVKKEAVRRKPKVEAEVKVEVATKPDVMNVAPNAMLKYFKYEHLPTGLKERSKLFHDLAVELDNTLPNNAEKTAGLRKLLEAKDCFVRASL